MECCVDLQYQKEFVDSTFRFQIRTKELTDTVTGKWCFQTINFVVFVNEYVHTCCLCANVCLKLLFSTRDGKKNRQVRFLKCF